MRGFRSIGAILAALLHASGACAADPSPKQASDIRTVATGLRQSLTDPGLSHALSRAGDWVREPEVSWTAHLDPHVAGGINTETATDRDEAAATAAAAAKRIAFAARPAQIDLGLLSFAAGGTDDRVWGSVMLSRSPRSPPAAAASIRAAPQASAR